MNQLDLLLKNSLLGLAAGSCDDEAEILSGSVEFGCVAFFRESSWKPSAWHCNAREYSRTSHPGLSISNVSSQVAYGSSRLEERNPATTLIVSPSDCPILDRKTAFLLQYSAPLSIFDIDFRKTAVADLSPRLKKELERKLAGV